MAFTSTSESQARTMVAWLIAALCGIAVALLVGGLAALITVVLGGEAMLVFTTAGAAFGGCLTLEIAVAGLYLAWRALRS
jgi:hypothetical protein